MSRAEGYYKAFQSSLPTASAVALLNGVALALAYPTLAALGLPPVYAIQSVVLFAVSSACGALVCRASGIDGAPLLSGILERRIRPRRILENLFTGASVGGVALLAYIGVSTVVQLALLLCFTPGQLEAVSKLLPAVYTPRLDPLSLLALAFWAGVYEETVFRFFLQPLIARVAGSTWVGIVGASLAWGLLHGGVWVHPATLALGVAQSLVTGALIGYLFDRKGLEPCIAAHSSLDLIRFLMMNLTLGAG